MARKKKVEGAYTVFLKVNGEEFSATSDTLLGAVELLPRVKPKTKGEIVVSSGGKVSKPLVLTIPNFNRLFYPGLTGEVQRSLLVKKYTLLS